MESKIAFNIYIILILRNPRILLLTLLRLYIMHFSAEYKREKKTNLKFKNKILERSGYDEVFYGDDGGEASDYNQIKDAVHSKLRY